MARPDFLIVGAMKAGTTTLYRDLVTHPQVFMPEQKEPRTLVRFDDIAAMERDYGVLFARATAGQLKGEASTDYTKRPLREGVAERAFALTGGDLRIVYIRRDPVARIVSHYLHERQLERTDLPIAEAIRRDPAYIAFSRYDWQIEPWKAAFGAGRVFELELEAYSFDRTTLARRVLAHIGADPALLPPVDETIVANSAGEMKHMKNGLLARLLYSQFYQRTLKPLVPRRWRESARRTLLPKAETFDVTLTDEDLAFIAAGLRGQ